MFEYYNLIDTKTEFKFLLPITYYKLQNVDNKAVKWVTEVEYRALQLLNQILND